MRQNATLCGNGLRIQNHSASKHVQRRHAGQGSTSHEKDLFYRNFVVPTIGIEPKCPGIVVYNSPSQPLELLWLVIRGASYHVPIFSLPPTYTMLWTVLQHDGNQTIFAHAPALLMTLFYLRDKLYQESHYITIDLLWYPSRQCGVHIYHDSTTIEIVGFIVDVSGSSYQILLDCISSWCQSRQSG